jgi:hypothetical protein
MNKQTAVEWLVAAIWGSSVEPPLHLKVAIEQAKEMEKEQIMEAAERWKGTDFAERYYNEQYGGDE